MTQKSESVTEQAELLIHAGFAADAALKLEGFEWPSVSTRTELVKAVAKSVTLRLAEEAQQKSECFAKENPLMWLKFAAWLTERAK